MGPLVSTKVRLASVTAGRRLERACVRVRVRTYAQESSFDFLKPESGWWAHTLLVTFVTGRWGANAEHPLGFLGQRQGVSVDLVGTVVRRLFVSAVAEW